MMARTRDVSQGPGLRLVYPSLATLILMMFLHVPTPYFVLSTLAPAIPFIFTYYWAIQRPSASPLLAVFFIAFIHDLWGGGIIGVTAFLAVLLHLAIAPNQEVFRVAPFPLRWAMFGVILAGMMALKWAVLSAMGWALIPPSDLIFQGVITIAVYPLFNRFYALIDRRVIMRDV